MRQLPISDQLKKNLQKGISTEPLFKKLNILSFEQQKKIVMEGFTWKVKKYTIPKTLQSHFCKWNTVYGQSIWPEQPQISYSTCKY